MIRIIVIPRTTIKDGWCTFRLCMGSQAHTPVRNLEGARNLPLQKPCKAAVSPFLSAADIIILPLNLVPRFKITNHAQIRNVDPLQAIKFPTHEFSPLPKSSKHNFLDFTIAIRWCVGKFQAQGW
ncbi:hypothetical protein ABW19_dt0201727 [Dactylella cylindrospora]|nr:hypothetical protein ABW19_dt0201727 [Dactylella cylindrospora]